MNVRRFVSLAASMAILFGVGAAYAQSPLAGRDTKGRKSYADQRPDESRGWLVVSKSSYWPLCYEALDRLESTKSLIGQSKPDELAESLEKCSAWLTLAGSAAMTDGRAGVTKAADLCEEAAEAVRSDSESWSEARLNDLIVLANLSMAKSHVLRAGFPDELESVRINRAVKEPNSETLRVASKEISRARLEQVEQQYRFDTVESLRHLEVANAYYQAACEQAGIEPGLTILDEIPELPESAIGQELTNYVRRELRPRITQALDKIDRTRRQYVTKVE